MALSLSLSRARVRAIGALSPLSLSTPFFLVSASIVSSNCNCPSPAHAHALTFPVLHVSLHPHTSIPTADMSSSTAEGPDPTKPPENMESDKAGEGGEHKEDAAGTASGVVSVLVEKLVRAISE